MSLPTTEQLEKLAKAQPGLAISAYVPFDNDAPSAVQANQIRVKNLIHDIEKVLKKNKSQLDAKPDQILKPLVRLRDDTQRLWQRQIQGLAVFVDTEQLQYFFLPMSIDEPIFQIQESFYLDPLTAAADDNQTFYALSVSHNHAQLYKANQYDITPIDVPDLPKNGMKEALSIDEYPKAHQFHGASPRSSRDNTGASGAQQHHGHYESNDVDKKLLEQYFRKLDAAIQKYLHNTQAPLVFAGVDYLFPIYQRANSYAGLNAKPVTGNYERASDEDLHKQLVNTISNTQ